MFKSKILSTAIITITCLAAPISQAQASTEAKQGASFITGAALGAALGGPVGLIIGALGGSYVAEEIKQADQAEVTQMTLSQAQAHIFQLQQQLSSSQHEYFELQQLSAQTLELQALFNTGSDELSFRDKQHMQNVADFLINNPDMQIRLDGHADIRGTDEYNNVLSQHRALNVKNQLIEFGVEAERIISAGHGSSQALAKQGENHSQDRRVMIEIFQPGEQSVASN